MQKTIIIIGNFILPKGNASGKRVYGNALLFNDLGYDVLCIGKNSNEIICNMGRIKSVPVKVRDGINRVFNNGAKDIIRELDRIHNERNVSAIVLYGALLTQRENILFIKWASRNMIPSIYDHVDWFEFNLKHPIRSFIRLYNECLAKRRVWPKCSGIICISKYLAAYHKGKGYNTVVIPPLADDWNEPEINKSDNQTEIKFVYAGTTADKHVQSSKWKDRLDIMFKAFADLTDRGYSNFTIDIFGMTKGRYLNMYPNKTKHKGEKDLEKIGQRVRFHGLIDNDLVEKAIFDSDFSILIRDNKKSNMAGFPTKVSESISCGTPVVCTFSSDLENYIVNGKNGYIDKLENTEIMIEKILRMNHSELKIMKEYCCYDKPFNYHKFVPQMRNFLEKAEIHECR